MNEAIYKKIKSNLDALSKPLDGLGDFEEIIARMGGIMQDEKVDINNAAVLVFISDNGIIREGVSQSDESVTESVAKMLGKRQTSVCFMAKKAGISVYPYNIGMKNRLEIDGVSNKYYISPSTHDFLEREAMSDEQMRSAIDAGKEITRELFDRGNKVVLLGEMGIGNTTTSTAVIASILKLSPEEITGKGAGLSDEGLIRKIEVIRGGISKYKLYEKAPLEVLKSVGGYDIAAMLGVIEAAYEIGIPVILDGLITVAAALVAVSINEDYKEVLFFSHEGKEKGIKQVASALNMKPIIRANMALGEGTGAVMYYELLKIAKAVYDANSTFQDSKIEAYVRL